MNARLSAVLPCSADLWPTEVHRDDRRIELTLEQPPACRGQLLGLPVGRYEWLRLDLDVPAGAERPETAWLYYALGLDPQRLVLRAGQPSWVPVPRRDDLLAVRLPHCPEVTVTAVTMILPPVVKRS